MLTFCAAFGCLAIDRASFREDGGVFPQDRLPMAKFFLGVERGAG